VVELDVVVLCELTPESDDGESLRRTTDSYIDPPRAFHTATASRITVSRSLSTRSQRTAQTSGRSSGLAGGDHIGI